jgi:hypothetical protein
MKEKLKDMTKSMHLKVKAALNGRCTTFNENCIMTSMWIPCRSTRIAAGTGNVILTSMTSFHHTLSLQLNSFSSELYMQRKCFCHSVNHTCIRGHVIKAGLYRYRPVYQYRV